MTDTTVFKYSDFKPVVSRKKRKKNLAQPSLFDLVQRAREELAKDDWIGRCQQILQDYLTAHSLSSSEILCLGLGSPSTSPNSRAQLGFLLEICEFLGIGTVNVSVYDPVFSEEDNALFEQLHIRILPENKDGRYPLEVPTILWMPHCDMDLYENLLRANWSREQLSRVILISNRLGDYVDSNPRHKLETRVPCILRLEEQELVDWCLLPASTARATAFNNIAIQTIGSNSKLLETWFTEIAKASFKDG